MPVIRFPLLGSRRAAVIPAALGVAVALLVPRGSIAAEKTLFERAVEGWMGVVAVVGEPGDRRDGDRHDGDRREHGDHERSGDRGEHHRGGPAGPQPPGSPWGGWQGGPPMSPWGRGRPQGPGPQGMMPWGPDRMPGTRGGMEGGPRPPFGAGPGQSDRMHDEMMRRHADAMRKIDEILDHVRRIDAQLGGRPPRHHGHRHAGPDGMRRPDERPRDDGGMRRPDAERPRGEGDRPREEGGREPRPERGRRPEVEPPQRGEADAERPRQRLDIPEDMRRMMQQKLDEGRRRMEQAQQQAEEGQRRSRELEERIRGLEAELDRLRAQQR